MLATTNQAVQAFNFNGMADVRVVAIEGEPWFVAKDVAVILGYSETAMMTRRLDEDESISAKMAGMNMKSTLINESGLYNAVLGSKKPEAKAFRKWVTSEVLPTIRKTGGAYMTAELASKAVADPDFLIGIAQQIKQMRAERDQAIATKAEIGTRREATAMNTASQKAKEVNKLKIELDKSKDYASVKAVERRTKQKFKWVELRRYCNAKEIEIKDIFDANYGSVKTYPAEAWLAVYGIDLDELF